MFPKIVSGIPRDCRVVKRSIPLCFIRKQNSVLIMGLNFQFGYHFSRYLWEKGNFFINNTPDWRRHAWLYSLFLTMALFISLSLSPFPFPFIFLYDIIYLFAYVRLLEKPLNAVSGLDPAIYGKSIAPNGGPFSENGLKGPRIPLISLGKDFRGNNSCNGISVPLRSKKKRVPSF